MDKSKKIEDVAKRRGFFWQSCEIYGGLSGFYDYAHLGTFIKRKWENIWRRYFLSLSPDYHEIEPSEIMTEGVFKASGHLESFVDPIVKCGKCGITERADHILHDNLGENFEGKTPKEMDEIINRHNIKCRACGGRLEEVGIMNMMFPLNVGVSKVTKAYPRPETAQGAYVNFRREFETLRKKLPLGLAIIGKVYRNEISPRNVLLRMREFTQAELQIFFDPMKINEHKMFDNVKNYELNMLTVENNETVKNYTCSDAVEKLGLPKFYVYHLAIVQKFYLDALKIPKELFRFRQLSDEEKAFYNKYHWDIELKFSLGWVEVAGCHYRTDHDLKGHQNISKNDMSVFVDGNRFIPHVLELSFGVDRNIYALFDMGYVEEKERTIFTFPHGLSPYDCAVFPLINKDGMDKKAKKLFSELSPDFSVFYDDSGSIGRRYRRMDEIGVSFCITIDGQTAEDDTITVRELKTMKQIRVRIKDLKIHLKNSLQ